MQYPVKVGAQPGDERSEGRGVHLTGPVGVYQVVVEGVTCSSVHVLVVDEDHHSFSHGCSLELKAPPVRTPEGSDGGEDSKSLYRQMGGSSQAHFPNANRAHAEVPSAKSWSNPTLIAGSLVVTRLRHTSWLL